MLSYIDLLRSGHIPKRPTSAAVERAPQVSIPSHPGQIPNRQPAEGAEQVRQPLRAPASAQETTVIPPPAPVAPKKVVASSGTGPAVRKAVESRATSDAGRQMQSRQGVEPRNRKMAGKGKDRKDWLGQCVTHTLRIFQAASRGRPVRIDHLSAHIRILLRFLVKKPEGVNLLELAISRSTSRIRGVDRDLGDLVEKSITMMLYAIKMGIHLQLDEHELHMLVLAAMLHHIGMARVSAFIRLKQEKLKSEERGQIELALKEGAAYLRSCGVSDNRILAAASQARERYDGSGEPLGLKGNEISPSARIIGLLSMFEALIHFRPYRRRLLPRDAIRELIIHHKKAFDPAMLRSLIESVSLYPVGTYVQLNTGDIGRVICVHRRLPLRPIIRLASDRHGNSIKPRDVDLQKQPNLQVERCMYPEELAAQEHRD